MSLARLKFGNRRIHFHHCNQYWGQSGMKDVNTSWECKAGCWEGTTMSSYLALENPFAELKFAGILPSGLYLFLKINYGWVNQNNFTANSHLTKPNPLRHRAPSWLPTSRLHQTWIYWSKGKNEMKSKCSSKPHFLSYLGLWRVSAIELSSIIHLTR